MPHTEIPARIPTLRKANSEFVGYLWGGVSGFKTSDDTGTRLTVRFTGEQSSSGVVQDLALLRAADIARERGKYGFVVRERRDYERTTNTLYYGATIRSDPNGHTTELDVDLIDSLDAPAAYKGAKWRIIPATEVIAKLAPVYVAPPAEEQTLKTP